MYNYGKRHIKLNEEELVESVTGEVVHTTNAEFPPVGHPILNLYKRLTGKSRNYLSPSQIERLTGYARGFGGELLSSPDKEYKDYPTEFTNFIDHIPDSPAYKARIKSERITPGLIIDVVTNYHWKGGWLQYKPKSAPKQSGIDILEIGLGHYDE